MEIGQIFLDRYSITEEIGSGSFGKVYKLQHIAKPKSFALKIDIRQKGNVLIEANILSELQGGIGVPKLYKSGKTDTASYMIMELLGMTVNNLLKNTKTGKFCLATTVSIIEQLISRIEFIHSKGYLHRDIKPHQMLVGKNSKIVYLIDFGLARKFEVNNYHINYQSQCPRAGNASYSSLNNHSGVRQSRRDDLESVAYTAIYLLKGSLPWQNTTKTTSNSKWQNIFVIKNSIKIETLCEGCPKEFGVFLNYCRNLKFEERPDYGYLQRLFAGIRKENNLIENFLEWIENDNDSTSGIGTLNYQRRKTSQRHSLKNIEKEELEKNFEEKLKNEEKKKIKKRNSKTVICKNNSIEKKKNSDVEYSANDKNFVHSLTSFKIDETLYNSLNLTPRNILPEMKSRKSLEFLENDRKPEQNCLIF